MNLWRMVERGCSNRFNGDRVGFMTIIKQMSVGGITLMRWLYLLSSCLLLTFVGCTSSGVVRSASPVSTSAPVSLDFILVETSSALDNSEADRQLLNEAIITGLRETQVFGDVSGNKAEVNSSSGMKIQVDIQKIKRVSLDARVWFGALAGRAQILAQVTVSDLKSGNQIQSFETEGKSGGSAMAGTTDEAIQRAAQRVVAEILKISRQTSQ